MKYCSGVRDMITENNDLENKIIIRNRAVCFLKKITFLSIYGAIAGLTNYML